MVKILCVIPSRLGSTRLQRKPLLPINGKPMIQLVYQQAKQSSLIDKVIVATDSLEIKSVIDKINGDAILTDPNLLTGSDRVAQVAEQFSDYQVIINLQGDEPFVKPEMLEQLVTPYLELVENKDNWPEMTTLARKITDPADYNNPGIVKVITDMQHNAIYFSRAPIPYHRETQCDNITSNIPVYRHMGLYAFRRDFLLQYTKLSRTTLETIESLEQLRAIEHGFKIRVCLTKIKTLEINTKEEYEQAQSFDYE
jgi:3-deoxy-manno-octulosonate cytidylyltransferase (CMP-KDO synthetase)